MIRYNDPKQMTIEEFDWPFISDMDKPKKTQLPFTRQLLLRCSNYVHPCTSPVPLSTISYDSMAEGGRAKHGARAEGFSGTFG